MAMAYAKSVSNITVKKKSVQGHHVLRHFALFNLVGTLFQVKFLKNFLMQIPGRNIRNI